VLGLAGFMYPLSRLLPWSIADMLNMSTRGVIPSSVGVDLVDNLLSDELENSSTIRSIPKPSVNPLNRSPSNRKTKPRVSIE
jgi:hypothetical protein